ncbi:hypothetical protein HDV04_004130 [Boothiomyces sp. JEL0838]|nr:hypothetical protein HDV04_004130 [Boothiomyces sp. JEL0838]
MEYIFGASGEDAVQGRKLQVRVGPSIQSLAIASVNDEENPHFIDSPLFTGNVLVRIKDFKGITPDGKEPKSCAGYFDNKKRLFALQVQGRFKHEYSADDLLFGSEFERKCTPPTGAWIAIKFANLIDPALQVDIYSETPWLYSPILCSMNIVNVVKATRPVVGAAPLDPKAKEISDKISTKSKDSVILLNSADPNYTATKQQEKSQALNSVTSKPVPSEILGEWIWKDGRELEENNTLLHTQEPDFGADAIAERRRYYQKQKTRKHTIFSPNNVYNFEIFAPFIDLNTFDLSLGININILRYLNNQPLRLMAKAQSSNKILFVIEFDLVEDPALKKANSPTK